MQCPNCRIDLQMTERHGVEIDYCPRCRGVWLDRGELDKIIERAGDDDRPRGVARQAPPGHDRRPGEDDYRGRDHRHPKSRKRGLLGELFDFD
jgi:uncharacterized protein